MTSTRSGLSCTVGSPGISPIRSPPITRGIGYGTPITRATVVSAAIATISSKKSSPMWFMGRGYDASPPEPAISERPSFVLRERRRDHQLPPPPDAKRRRRRGYSVVLVEALAALAAELALADHLHQQPRREVRVLGGVG